MRTMDFRPGRGRAGRASLMAQLELLIGDKRRLVAALASLSLLSGFSEGLFLAIVAQVAYKIVNGKSGSARAGLLHIGASVNTLLWIALGLALFRLVLQWPISVLPAKIAADVQLRLRTRIFRAFSNASWDVQSRDREGQLQEIMTNQTSQATGGRAAGDEPRQLLADLRDPDGLRDRAQPDGGGSDLRDRGRPVRAHAPDADARRQAQPRTLPCPGALRGRDRRGQPPGGGVAGVRGHRRPVRRGCSASCGPAATSSSARR